MTFTAFSSQKEPAEHRNQVKPPELISAAHTMRSDLYNILMLRHSADHNIDKAANDKSVCKCDQAECDAHKGILSVYGVGLRMPNLEVGHAEMSVSGVMNYFTVAMLPMLFSAVAFPVSDRFVNVTTAFNVFVVLST